MTSIIGRPTIQHDIQNYTPLIERHYAAGTRLLTINNEITSSISDILSGCLKKQSCIELIERAVNVQMKYKGSGGRSVALMSVLWYGCVKDLVEQGIDQRVVIIVMQCVVEKCVERMKEFKMSTQGVDLLSLCKGLAHGCKNWKLVSKAVSSLTSFTSLKQVSVLYEQSVVPSLVHAGVLVPSTAKVRERERIVILCGDLCSDYNHTGYKGILKEAQIFTPNLAPSTSQLWLNKITTHLTSLSITSILVSGKLDPDLAHYCSQNNINIISTKYDTLARLSDQCDVAMLPFLDACTARDVIEVKCERVDEIWVSISPQGSDHVTILLRSCNKIKGSDISVTSLVARVQAALQDQHVLPGRGVTELKLSQTLSHEVDLDPLLPQWQVEDVTLYSALICQRFCQSLLRAEHLARTNNEGLEEFNFDDLDSLSLEDVESEVYDVLSIKESSWLRAFEVTRVLLGIGLAVKPPPPPKEK